MFPWSVVAVVLVLLVVVVLPSPTSVVVTPVRVVSGVDGADVGGVGVGVSCVSSSSDRKHLNSCDAIPSVVAGSFSAALWSLSPLASPGVCCFSVGVRDSVEESSMLPSSVSDAAESVVISESYVVVDDGDAGGGDSTS